MPRKMVQHQEDQDQRGHQHKGHLLGQARQQAQARYPVDDGQEQRRQRRKRHRQDDDFVLGRWHAAFQPTCHQAVVHLGPDHSHRGANEDQRQQRLVPRVAVGLAIDACLGRQCRGPLGQHDGDDHHKQHIQAHQHEAGYQGACIQVAHRAAQLVGQHDQHQRRWDGLRQCARRGDGAGGQHTAIAVAQHDGQRDQTHGDHGRSHHAGGRCQQRAHQNNGNGHTAPHGAKDLAHGLQQVFGHAGLLQDDAHEGEERNRQQCVVLHDPEYAQRQRLEQHGGEEPQFNADPAKPHAGRRQGKRHRKARQQQQQQAAKQQRYKVLCEEGH